MPKKFYKIDPNGLYYKPILIVNDDSSIINKLEASLIDDASVVIYDCHVFIVQATGHNNLNEEWNWGWNINQELNLIEENQPQT